MVSSGSGRLEYARVERRELSTESKGCPPSRRGGGSGLVCAAETCELPAVAALASIPATVARRVTIGSEVRTDRDDPPCAIPPIRMRDLLIGEVSVVSGGKSRSTSLNPRSGLRTRISTFSDRMCLRAGPASLPRQSGVQYKGKCDEPGTLVAVQRDRRFIRPDVAEYVRELATSCSR